MRTYENKTKRNRTIRPKRRKRVQSSAPVLELEALVDPKISCLCVTYNRPEFFKFLLWNFEKQTWKNKELIVIDGSVENHAEMVKGNNIRYEHIQNLKNISAKRNIALKAAQGDIITWFDDDDWQHPKKCEILCHMLSEEKAYGGCSASLFYNILSGDHVKHRGSGRILFNAVGVRTEIARKVSFDETVKKAGDHNWMRKLEKICGRSKARFIDHPLFFWLCHQKNISNPVTSLRFHLDDENEWFLEVLKNEKEQFDRFIKKMRQELIAAKTPLPAPGRSIAIKQTRPGQNKKLIIVNRSHSDVGK